MLKPKVNWRAVYSDVAQMHWCAIVRSPVTVDVLEADLCGIIGVKVSSIEDRRQPGDKLWFYEFCKAPFRRKQARDHR